MAPRATTRDLQRVLDAIALLHGCDDPAELPSRMRAAASSLVPGEIVAYSEFDLSGLANAPADDAGLEAALQLFEASPVIFTDDPGVQKAANALCPWMVRYADEHPLFCLALEEPDPPVAKLSDFLTLPKLRDTGVYQQFFGPLGVTRQIATCPTQCHGIVTGLTVNRGGRDFDERERLRLALLTPHLREAFRSISLRARLRTVVEDRTALLGDLPSAVLFLDPAGQRVLFETKAARKLLTRCFPGPEGRSETLPQGISAWLGQVLRSHGDLVVPKAVDATVTLRVSAGDLDLRATPSPRGVYLLLRLRQDQDEAERLMELGLTRREAEVLAVLRTGLTNPQIGRRLHISLGTVRTHVERIRTKLGVSTRAAAIRTAEEHLRQDRDF